MIMKKLLYIFAAAALVVVACSKDELANQNENAQMNNEQVANGKVTLTATMPAFTNVVSKASVSDAGVFSWTAGDVIDVVYVKAGESELKYTFECTNSSTGEFTSTEDIASGYSLKTEGTIAYYPHEYNGTPSNQTFDTPALAAKGFQMHATLSAGKLAFVHDNAMMKVTVTNVPSFAKLLVVGGAEVNLSYAADQASATYSVPVAPTALAKLSIAVKDGGDNNIINKTSQKANEIKSAHFYPLNDLPIGPVLLIKNNVVSEMTGAEKSWDTITDTEGAINIHTWNAEKAFTSFDTKTSVLKSVTISDVAYSYYVYPAGTTGSASVIIYNLDDADGYPRTQREITVPSNSAIYTVGYGLGLKKSDEDFCYAYHEDSDDGIFVYSWSPEAFGSWDGCLTPTGTTTMWKNGRQIHFYLKNGFTTTSGFNIRSGETGNAKLGGDNSGSGVNFIDGDCAIGYWSNGGGSGWYSPGTIKEYLQKGPWK